LVEIGFEGRECAADFVVELLVGEGLDSLEALIREGDPTQITVRNARIHINSVAWADVGQ